MWILFMVRNCHVSYYEAKQKESTKKRTTETRLLCYLMKRKASNYFSFEVILTQKATLNCRYIHLTHQKLFTKEVDISYLDNILPKLRRQFLQCSFEFTVQMSKYMTISTRLSALVIHCTAEKADQFAYEKTNKQTNKCLLAI